MYGWRSIKEHGYPPADIMVLVTLKYDGGYRDVEEGYRYLKDASEWADTNTIWGKEFVKSHPDGIWTQWHSDGFDLYACDAKELVTAWMPYPEPYDG